MVPALSLRSYLASSRSTLLVIALAIVGVFLPVVIITYAFTDDYPVLAITNGLGPSQWFGSSIINTTAAGGRPFAGLLDQLVFSAASTIDNLRFVRLLTVIGIAALALLLHWALVRAGVSRAPAALIAVLVCSMPSFQVYASWAVLFNVPYAALLSGGASLLVLTAVDGPPNLLVDRIVGGVAMLLGSLLIYQPAAMFFWVFLAIALIGAADESTRVRRVVRAHFGVAAIALLLAFVVQRLAIHIVGNTVPNHSRNELTHDVPGKVGWFLHKPLFKALNLFDLTPSWWLAAFVASVAVAGIVLLVTRRSSSPVLVLVVAALLVPLCYLPNLVVKEDFASFRSLGALVSLVALYFSLGALGLGLAVRASLRRRLNRTALHTGERFASVAAISFVAVVAFFAAKNVTTLFAEPQSTELRMIRSQVAALPTGTSRLAFIPTAYYWGMTKLVIIDEFGLPSTSQLWTLEPSVDLILREEGRLDPGTARPTVDLLPWYTKTHPKNEPVIDVRGLQRLR